PMVGAIPVSDTTRPVATTIRRGRSHAGAGARSAAGRLLGIRRMARINEPVTRAKDGRAGRLTGRKPMVARANAAQPASAAAAQPDRVAVHPYATANAAWAMVPSMTASAALAAKPLP